MADRRRLISAFEIIDSLDAWETCATIPAKQLLRLLLYPNRIAVQAAPQRRVELRRARFFGLGTQKEAGRKLEPGSRTLNQTVERSEECRRKDPFEHSDAKGRDGTFVANLKSDP